MEQHPTTFVVHISAGRPSFRLHRLDAAVVPDDFDLGHLHLFELLSFGEHEPDRLCMWSAIRQEQGGGSLHSRGVLQLQADVHGVQDMAGHITQRTCSKIPPPTPIPGRIDFVVRTHRSGAREQIPVEGVGHQHFQTRSVESLRPYGTVGECFDLLHLADFTVPYPLSDLTDAFARRSLVAHLGRHLVLLRELCQQPRLVH